MINKEDVEKLLESLKQLASKYGVKTDDNKDKHECDEYCVKEQKIADQMIGATCSMLEVCKFRLSEQIDFQSYARFVSCTSLVSANIGKWMLAVHEGNEDDEVKYKNRIDDAWKASWQFLENYKNHYQK